MALDIEASHGLVGRRPLAVQEWSDLAHRCAATPSNAELLDGCRLGDVASWDELVARYERLVYAIPMREGLSAADAAEICQSAFEALIQSIDRIQSPERLGYWLMTVARRLTWRRRTAQRAEVSLGHIDTEPATDDHAADWARTVDVYDAVAQLGAPCRDLLFGLFFDPAEPSYDQLSRSLGIAVGSVGPMRRRCLEQIRHRLQP